MAADAALKPVLDILADGSRSPARPGAGITVAGPPVRRPPKAKPGRRRTGEVGRSDTRIALSQAMRPMVRKLPVRG